VVRVNFADMLEAGAALTGTPTVAEVTTSDLTLDNKAVTTADYVSDKTGKTVSSGDAVTFTVAGGSDGTTYTIRITVSTNSSPVETLVQDIQVAWT